MEKATVEAVDCATDTHMVEAASTNGPPRKRWWFGRFDAHFLAIAKWCYWFQSEVLRVPDRYGPFVSGPPGVQLQQGVIFVLNILVIGSNIFILSLAGLWLYLSGRPVMRFAAAMAWCQLVMTVLGWEPIKPRRPKGTEGVVSVEETTPKEP